MSHKFVSKGWGYESWIVNKEYCGKILFLKKDRQMSLHYHKLKDETFYIQDGQVLLCYYDKTRGETWIDNEILTYHNNWNDFKEFMVKNMYGNIVFLKEGDSFHIPVGMRHALFGTTDAHIIEFSTYHQDSDSYRILKGD